jgi:ribosomal protein S18 acetylase RimI-like enzyme
VRIRIASIDDLGTILTLNGFVQRRHAEALPQMFRLPTDSEQSVEAFSAILKAPDNLVLLAENAEPVGYLYAQFQSRPASWVHLEIQVLYIQHMVIAPKFRRRGVGTLLLSGAMDSARSKGINRVELDVWAFNSEAKSFYTKHGFEVFNERMQLSINGS